VHTHTQHSHTHTHTTLTHPHTYNTHTHTHIQHSHTHTHTTLTHSHPHQHSVTVTTVTNTSQKSLHCISSHLLVSATDHLLMSRRRTELSSCAKSHMYAVIYIRIEWAKFTHLLHLCGQRTAFSTTFYTYSNISKVYNYKKIKYSYLWFNSKPRML